MLSWIEHEKSFVTLGPVVSYKQKFVHRVLVNYLVSACPGKNVVRLFNRLDMTIAVDWDTKPQTQ